MLHARRHFAPHGILAVEEAGIVEADAELRIGAVGVHRPRHRADATHIVLTAELGGKLGLVRAAGAGAGRIAALRTGAGAIGRASGRERVCQLVWFPVYAGSYKKTNKTQIHSN